MAPSEWGACCSPKFSVSKALVGSVRPNKPPHRESRESFPSSERGVRVLVLCPGATDTPFFDRVCAEDASLGKCAMPESVVDAAMKAFAKNRSHAIVRAGNLLDGAGQPPRVARALGPAHRRSDEATLQTSADCTRTRAREPASPRARIANDPMADQSRLRSLPQAPTAESPHLFITAPETLEHKRPGKTNCR